MRVIQKYLKIRKKNTFYRLETKKYRYKAIYTSFLMIV